MATTKKSEGQYFEGIGRRKESVARVRVTPAKKTEFVVNGKELHFYFPTEELQKVVKQPMAVLADLHFNISIQAKGGGMHSQAEAASMGLARAIEKSDETNRGVLKKAKLLTSNSRQKERRKFGLKKARKAPQWSKR